MLVLVLVLMRFPFLPASAVCVVFFVDRPGKGEASQPCLHTAQETRGQEREQCRQLAVEAEGVAV